MTLEQLEKLKVKVNNDLQLTDANVLDKSLNLPILYQKYLDVFISQMRVFKNLERDKQNMYSKKYHHYKFEGDFQLDSKGEIETYINGDDDYDELLRKYNVQALVIEYLENVLDNIKKLTFTIKNYVTFKMFLSGQ